jgi:eukaryotic-like serine/threonine-protein kinase
MVSVPVKAGDILAGKYRVERVLGTGGMGVVIAATHLDLLELRALKFNTRADAEATSRFLREARAAAKLKSEHIAKVYDVGRLDNGAPYMVMEYLEGCDLKVLLKTYGRLPTPTAALYALQVCSALAEAHTSCIVHRDLKPANLFLTHRPDGSPCIKVLDFGISKVLSHDSEFDITKTQQLMGSPLYMSPEQMRSTRSADFRSDIWSLGVILYKMVTGKVPFTGHGITELVSVVLETAPIPPSQCNPALPPILDDVILRCLRQNREERYANVVELAADLARFAPSGATAIVEAMTRVFAAAPPGARVGASSTSVERSSAPETPLEHDAMSPSSPLSVIHAAASPACGGDSVSAEQPVPATVASALPPAAPPAVPIAEPTTASNFWGRTASRVPPRANLPLLMALFVALSLLAGSSGGWFRSRSPASSADARSASSLPGPAVAGATQTAALQVEPSEPSIGAATSAELRAPAPQKVANAKAEPKSRAGTSEPTAKSKSAPVGRAKPARRSMLGTPPLYW